MSHRLFTRPPAPLVLRLLLWLAVAAWMWVIFAFSAQTGESSSGLSGRIAAVLSRWLFDTDWNALEPSRQQLLEFALRKTAHFCEYALLGFLWAAALKAQGASRQGMLLAPLAGLVYAGADEWHQSFVPGRSPGLRDVAIDFCGVLAGVIFLCLCAALAGWLAQKKGRCA